MEGMSEGMREFMERAQGVSTKESLEKGLNFKPRPDDVLVATPSKSGTTWMQQICHGLRTGGSMDFEEMSLVIPFIELAHDYGYTDLQKEQVAYPRMFKTHFWYPSCPKGAGKYVYVVRDPKDACVSMYHFLGDWIFDKNKISLEEFVLTVCTFKGPPDSFEEATNWQHIASWYPHRKDSSVLWLHFEDLKEELPACVKLVAEFLDIGAKDEKLQALVTKQASLDFMKEHYTKFDEHVFKTARNSVAGLPDDAGLRGGNMKIRKGEVGESKKVLPQHVIDKLDAIWKEDVEPATGYASYAELRSGINKELGRPFASTA